MRAQRACSSFAARRTVQAVAGLALSILAARGAELPAIAEAMMLARDAAEASTAGDHDTALAKYEQAVELRPDVPRLLLGLATEQTAAGKSEDAVATLNRVAALGLATPADRAPEFAALRRVPGFKEVARRLAENQNPVGEGEIAFTLQGVTGLIEAIAWREKTGDFFFGDVNARAVWVRNKKDNTLRRFTPEGDELLGVFALAIDESSGTLWAATAAVPEMRDFLPEQTGSSALAEVDLGSGAIRRVIALPRGPGEDGDSHLLGNLALASDGTVFLVDRGTAGIWRLGPGESALTLAATSPEFLSLDAIAVMGGGDALLVADSANGLLRVALPEGAVTRIPPPENRTLVGIHSLAVARDGKMLAVQNGVRPPRVIRIALDESGESATSVTVLEAAHISMPAPALGCLAEGNFYFIANAGWSRFEAGGNAPTARRTVGIFRSQLTAPGATRGRSGRR